MRIPLIVLSLAWGSSAAAGEWQPLAGTYAITGASVVDPPPDEAADTHLRVQLEGAAARELWDAMKVEAVEDECTGAMARRVGGMQCLHFAEDGTYECSFAVDVMAQRIGHGTAC